VAASVAAEQAHWTEKVEDWVRRHAVPFGTVQASLTVEYQHGQPVLIRLRVSEVEEKIR
jgi:hypothetical protein